MRPYSVRREESAPGAGTPSVTSRSGQRMSRELRVVILITFALLWLAGAAWLVLHYFFAQQTEFGALPNRFEPLTMRLHGWLAVAGVFLLGWIGAGHLSERWSSGRNRLSGLLLAGSALLLIASGYALYYTTGTVHEVAARVHEWLGVAAVLAALQHWWRLRTPQALRASASLR